MENRYVLVTGSNRGIGSAVMRKFAANGYNIYAHARAATSEFEELVCSVRSEYAVEVEPLCFDLTDSGGMEAAMRGMIRGKKGLDVLVNNAGVMHSGLFQMTELETVRRVFDVNLFAVMELTQWALKIMARKKRGSIVNLSSITGLDLGPGQCAYGVSKAAVAAFTQALASEVRNYGIRVNAVAPGIADTRMADEPQVQQERARLEASKSPLSRLADPQEIADAVWYLASEQSSFVTGQVLRVDGGNRLV